MSEHRILPELTTESIVALSAATGVTPSPLILSQLGLKTEDDFESNRLLSILDRGVRTLKMMQAFAYTSEELSEALRLSIAAMGNADIFVIFVRSDQPEARVVYSGEQDVIDVVSPYGNHCLELMPDAIVKELDSFFGEASKVVRVSVTSPLERFEDDATPSSDEDPVISRLASGGAVDHMVTVCDAAEVNFDILKWRSIDEEWFAIDTQDSQVTFTSVGSADCIESVLAATQQIRQR